jgi:AraC-like DNA-binding protein
MMANNNPSRLIFNTDDLPERDRFPTFCESVMRRYAALDIVTADTPGFRSSLELQRVGSIDVGLLRTAPADLFRTPALVRDGDDALCIFLCRSGAASKTQCNLTQDFVAGEAVVADNGYSGLLHVAADSNFWSVKVARPRLSSLLPHLNNFAVARLDKNIVALRLLFGYLQGTYNVDFSGGGGAARLYDEHIVDLIALALGAEGETRNLVERRGVQAVRRAAILHEIEARVADVSLNATTVAARIGVTPRYVHILLEQTGRSFTQHLLEKRLERAMMLLQDPQRLDLKISDIALEAGFSDISHFSRTFRRNYGETPSAARASGKRRT